MTEKCRRQLEQWQIERNQKIVDKQEQREKERLELLQQIQENREQKIKKRREELALDEKYLQDCEAAEILLVEQENQQRKKNIEYYTELAEIVDAQRNRHEKEITTLKAKLSGNKEEVKMVGSETVSVAPEISSDDDSIYFDAEKNPESAGKIGTTMRRSSSDYLNSNMIADELAMQRLRNRANILTSNIYLSDADQTEEKQVAISTDLTDAQKNKLKTFQHEYGMGDSDSNSNQVIHSTEMSDLQKNRSRVLNSELGMTPAIVNVQVNSSIESGKDLNANAAGEILSDLQRNRQKVMMQEYDFRTYVTPVKTKEKSSERKTMRVSLSLELDHKPNSSNELGVKPCQSDFLNSPMSTTSDDLVASTVSGANGEVSPVSKGEVNGNITEKTDRNILKLDCDKANEQMEKEINLSAFTANANSSVTPLSALNTAGILSKREGFSFHQPRTKPTSFSELLRPTFSSTNIFDLSPQLNANKMNKLNASSPTDKPMKKLSKLELQELNSANLTNFFQQSFTIPLQMHLTILNNEILRIFFEDLDIFNHFQSLRNYFFMMDGEFASNISDGLLTKLQSVQKPHELLNSHALHSILENALQSSLMGNDKNAENLSFFIPNVPDEFHLASPNVLSELHLSYKVDWPLNLLLSPEAIEHYGRVFQHLLKLRRITWSLEQCFYVCFVKHL